MITLLYSLVASELEPFSNAVMLLSDNGNYVLTIPTPEDWSTAQVAVNNYPAVDVQIVDRVIEIKGRFFEPAPQVWVDITIAKGSTKGGAYRFPLEVVPLPRETPRFTGTKTINDFQNSFWWSKSDYTPICLFSEELRLMFNENCW